MPVHVACSWLSLSFFLSQRGIVWKCSNPLFNQSRFPILQLDKPLGHWMILNSSYDFASRILCVKHGFSSFSPNLTPWSDVYNFGVILWELATEKIPWDNLNSMQMIGAVGFMEQRLEIPKDVDPRWAAIVESCWHSDPTFQPTFQEMIERLRELQNRYALQFQAARYAGGESTQKES